MSLCINCINFQEADSIQYSKCKASEQTTREESPITGEVIVKTTSYHCSTMRECEHLCGKSAKLFEIKPELEPKSKLTTAIDAVKSLSSPFTRKINLDD